MKTATEENTRRMKVKRLPSDDTENGEAMTYLLYAISRGETVETLLEYPITSRPLYLMDLEHNKVFLKNQRKLI